ncbi:GLPGLI family protein [Flavobacterium ammonificans]|jgi:GLPGLI family protein|uniref:GLPGLI family protein n=1 Tax=Flavobacterium ammonificans TaxID=1751056 RepID=UPI001E2B207A|nr:GLPGLI family protein [Flavobacterium ammonificans]BDB56607.1 GLPGLI family protein [Flavobacterium ammonificans]
MKKTILLFFFALVYTNSFAQKDFQGMAVYESKTSTSDFKARFEGNKSITPDMQKMMEERMKKMFEKTFVLNFDKSASIYKEEEKLEASNQGGGFRMMSSMTGGGGTYYKNVKDKTYSVDKDFMGKEFLVKDSLASLNWKMEAETRVIGGYTCYKATAVKAASKTDFRNFRPKKEEAAQKDSPKKEETAQQEKPKEAPKTSFMDALELPKEITITAWYTPEIPVSQGPEGYWGLPGLILEVNDGKTIILCSKVVLNPKEKTEIKAPSKGKTVSQNEYDEIVVKKMEEFREMNQGRSGGGGFQIRMGQ